MFEEIEKEIHEDMGEGIGDGRTAIVSCVPSIGNYADNRRLFLTGMGRLSRKMGLNRPAMSRKKSTQNRLPTFREKRQLPICVCEQRIEAFVWTEPIAKVKLVQAKHNRATPCLI